MRRETTRSIPLSDVEEVYFRPSAYALERDPPFIYFTCGVNSRLSLQRSWYDGGFDIDRLGTGESYLVAVDERKNPTAVVRFNSQGNLKMELN